MAFSTCAEFLVGLRSQLRARFSSGTYEDVDVYLVAPGDTSLKDSIVLVWGRITGDREHAAMRVRSETWRIPARAFASSTSPDASVAFLAAAERVEGIVGEVVEQLSSPPQVGATTMDAQVANTTIVPITLDQGGWGCEAEFTIEYTAQVRV